SIEAVYAGAGTAVDRQPPLLDRRGRQARRRPPHRRWACVASSDGDAGKRIPELIRKIGRRFQVILDDRRSNAIGRERVGNRKEQAPCEDAAAVAKQLGTERSGFVKVAESAAGETERGKPYDCTDPQHRSRAARHIQKHKRPDATDGGADQIRSVDLSDRVGATGQRKTHDNTRKEKRKGETKREFRPGR